MSTAGALFLAHEQQQIEHPRQAHCPPPTAPLYEAAAAHDGQPADAWLRYFLDRWQG